MIFRSLDVSTFVFSSSRTETGCCPGEDEAAVRQILPVTTVCCSSNNNVTTIASFGGVTVARQQNQEVLILHWDTASVYSFATFSSIIYISWHMKSVSLKTFITNKYLGLRSLCTVWVCEGSSNRSTSVTFWPMSHVDTDLSGHCSETRLESAPGF